MNFGGKGMCEPCQIWKVMEKEVLLIEPLYEKTEEPNELIRRCDLSINKTRCYIVASELGTLRVHGDIISEDKYLD